jgi:hypothetical protein
MFAVTAVFAAALFLLGVIASTPKDRAYRAISPDAALCNMALDEAGNKYTSKSWSILADLGNDETLAINEHPSERWDLKFQCAIQRHEIPYLSSTKPTLAHEPLLFTLGFIEFKENGEPFELVKNEGQPFTPTELSDRVRYIKQDDWKPITQLEALTAHLRHVEKNGHSNYVIAFVHGWRHDASIGDGNVADLRVYAAHVARFLRDRCQSGERSQCDREVTAVYFGWRGARLDEAWLRRPFEAAGRWVGKVSDWVSPWSDGSKTSKIPIFWKLRVERWAEYIASIAVAPTLFDRKPVSEYIAPYVYMALRKIESDLKLTTVEKKWLINGNRFIVFGHSLGGNILATALRDDLIKAVHRHIGGTYFDSPLGNLVVLINPAAEASKWTNLQRAVWDRIAFLNKDSDAEILAGHNFFPEYQRPAVISVTSAYAWPPGGIRPEDCAIAKNYDLTYLDQASVTPDVILSREKLTKNLKAAIDAADQKTKTGINYDDATYLDFPLFRGDFRTVGDMIAQWGRGGQSACDLQSRAETRHLDNWQRFGDFIRDLPFQNTDMESSRTIGHFDPPRPPTSIIDSSRLLSRQLGTTHEIRGITSDDQKQLDYDRIPSADNLSCPSSHDWLTRARRYMVNLSKTPEHPLGAPSGTKWDSTLLADPLLPDINNDHESGQGPAVHITHGFFLAGIQPITRANDPFWNMRAYDNVLMEHNGFMFPPFICAMNQFVMDEPTRWPVEPVTSGAPITPLVQLPSDASTTPQERQDIRKENRGH